MKQDTYYGYVGCSTIFTFVFFAFGIGFYLSGCNPDVSDTCINYKPFNDAIVYKIVVEPFREYSVCTYRCGNSCCAWKTTQYYNAYVYAHKGPQNSTFCYTEVAHNETKSYAEKQANKYHLGESVSWLKEKYGNECITSETAHIYWVVGVVFLSLMGASALVGIGAMIYYNGSNYLSEKQKEQREHKTQNSHNDHIQILEKRAKKNYEKNEENEESKENKV